MIRVGTALRRRLLARGLATLALLVGIAVAASLVRAAFPGENGRLIVYARDETGNPEICVMNADGAASARCFQF